MLPRAQRLLKFEDVFREGKKARGRYTGLRFVWKPGGGVRIGFAVARAVRGKVSKNRLRRQMRSICRLHMEEFCCGCDMVVSIFSAAAGVSYKELDEDFIKMARSAGITREDRQEWKR